MDAAIRLAEFTHTFHLGGTEVQVVELLRGLPEGYDVRVSVVKAEGPLMATLREMKVWPAEFPIDGSVMRPQTAVQIGRLALWLKANRIQLLHAHDFYATLLGVPAARLAGSKVIVGRLDLAHWHSRPQRAVMSRLTRMADGVVVNAEAIRTQLIQEEHIPSERITLIHNGLDLPRFDARVKTGLASPLPDVHGEPVIVHVANMNHPVKRQEDLLEALGGLRRQGLKAQLFLVGDGPRRQELEALARALGVSEHAHFLGHRTDVPAVYAQATVGVLCSSAEGLSNAVIEGMASSLPMVVTRVGASPDVVHEGVSGYVVEPAAPLDLAAGLRKVLEHPAEGKKMGRAGRAFVKRELSLEKMVKHHDALYRRLVLGAMRGKGAVG